MDGTRRLLEDRGASRPIADFAEFWDDLHRFIDLRHARGSTRHEILAPGKAMFRYDIEGWIGAGMPLDTAAFLERFGIPLTEIGVVAEGEPGVVTFIDGNVVDFTVGGFDHFSKL